MNNLIGIAAELAEKIRSRKARVGVVGLGYVGLPLAVEFAQEGFQVVGIDLNEKKCASVNAGESRSWRHSVVGAGATG